MDLSQQKELVEKARQDPEAFGELYDHFYSRIFSFVLGRIASVQIAQDITSEVFFKALKNLGQYHGKNNVPFSSWLYRIATNQTNDYFRKNKHRVISLEVITDRTDISDPSLVDENIQLEAELERQEDFLALHQSISRLPVKYQEVITLRFFGKKQEKEIAQILGRPEGTVKSLLHRGIKKLREMME
ncbi:RNA polymerase sigma factor [Chloroflexota bacterium]